MTTTLLERAHAGSYWYPNVVTRLNRVRQALAIKAGLVIRPCEQCNITMAVKTHRRRFCDTCRKKRAKSSVRAYFKSDKGRKKLAEVQKRYRDKKNEG
jgi:hypothetical protein